MQLVLTPIDAEPPTRAYGVLAGRAGPATGGSAFTNSATAARSSGGSCDVLRTTAVIEPPTES